MKKQFLILGVVMSLCAASYAQNSQLTLTLDEAIEIALDENPTLQVAELEIERYDYVLGATRGNLMPQLSATGSYTYTVVAQQMSEAFAISPDGVSAISVGATLSVPLVMPSVYSSMKLNRMQITESIESARGSQIDMVAAVKGAFYATLLAQESLTVLEQSAATAKEVVDDTQVKFDNGLVAEYDLLTAQVQYNNLQPSIIQARNSIELAKLTLKMYLSLPEEVELSVVGALAQMREQVFAGNDALTLDIENNSTLRSLEIQGDMLAQQLKLNKSTMLPTIAAFVSANYYGSQSADIGFDATGNMVAGDISYYGQFPVYAGLNISIPIFSGMSNFNRSREIRNQMEQLELQTLYARQATQLEAQSSINNLLAARERMYAEQTTIAQAQKAYDISQVRYDEGMGTILELNSAQLSLTQSELNYSQSIYDFLVAKAEYDKIIGVEY